MGLKEIRKAIVATLAQVDGNAPYTFDLSKTGQVKSGKYERPPGPTTAPFACVWLMQIDENATGLPAWTQQATYMVHAWVKGSPKHPEARQDLADDMLDDLRTALRTNLRLRYQDVDRVQSFTISAGLWDDEATAKVGESDAHVVLAISALWRERP